MQLLAQTDGDQLFRCANYVRLVCPTSSGGPAVCRRRGSAAENVPESASTPLKLGSGGWTGGDGGGRDNLACVCVLSIPSSLG